MLAMEANIQVILPLFTWIPRYRFGSQQGSWLLNTEIKRLGTNWELSIHKGHLESGGFEKVRFYPNFNNVHFKKSDKNPPEPQPATDGASPNSTIPTPSAGTTTKEIFQKTNHAQSLGVVIYHHPYTWPLVIKRNKERSRMNRKVLMTKNRECSHSNADSSHSWLTMQCLDAVLHSVDRK